MAFIPSSAVYGCAFKNIVYDNLMSGKLNEKKKICDIPCELRSRCDNSRLAKKILYHPLNLAETSTINSQQNSA